MAPTAAETTAAILRNARAAERERLRNIARHRWPDLTDDDLEDKVRELQVEKLREAGRRGRASQQANAVLGRDLRAVHPWLLASLEDLLTVVRSLTPADDQPDTQPEVAA
jgi:hypothetical protein